MNFKNLKYHLFYPGICAFCFLMMKLNPPIEIFISLTGILFLWSALSEKKRISISFDSKGKRGFNGWPEIWSPEYMPPFQRIFGDISGKGQPQPTIIQSPPPLPQATEKFNEALLPFQVEQAKALQPIILEQLIPLFKESGVPALREQATQLAETFLPLINQIGQTASSKLADVSRPDFESGFVGIGKETSDLMFQRAQERIAPQFQLARERTGERAAGRGTLRSGTTAKSLRNIDLAEIEARRVSAIDQAIFEYSEGQRLREVAETRRQTGVREAQTAAGFTPTPYITPQASAPQFAAGGFINPTPPQVVQNQSKFNPLGFALGAASSFIPGMK